LPTTVSTRSVEPICLLPSLFVAPLLLSFWPLIAHSPLGSVHHLFKIPLIFLLLQNDRIPDFLFQGLRCMDSARSLFPSFFFFRPSFGSPVYCFPVHFFFFPTIMTLYFLPWWRSPLVSHCSFDPSDSLSSLRPGLSLSHIQNTLYPRCKPPALMPLVKNSHPLYPPPPACFFSSLACLFSFPSH